MSQGEVRIETIDADLGVVRVTIDRAPVNAMGLHLYQELTNVFGRLRFEDGTKCAILTGAGDRAFVAGSDIGEFASCRPRMPRSGPLSSEEHFLRSEIVPYRSLAR